MKATVAAFTKGEAWLDALRTYIYQNKRFVASYIEREIPDVKLVPSQATYLLWLDCSRLIGCAVEAADYLRRETGLYLCEGSQYGGNGENFLRINIACPKSVLQDGLERLKAGLSAYEAWAAQQC